MSCIAGGFNGFLDSGFWVDVSLEASRGESAGVLDHARS